MKAHLLSATAPVVREFCPPQPQTRDRVRILLVEDDHDLRNTCERLLAEDGYDVRATDDGREACALLAREEYHIALLAWHAPNVPGLDLLRTARARNPVLRAILMSRKPSVDTGIAAMSAGAWAYLPKPFSAIQLQVLVGRAAHLVFRTWEAQCQAEYLQRTAGNSDRIRLLGVAPLFRDAIRLARRVAATDASVLLTGESGSGKELFAQFIHHHSQRAAKPFLAVNCAALPDALLESEMFGHRRGAFTGAIRDKPGLLEVANGGTLLLDELIEMSKPIQAKLLRVIQDGVVRRVGSESADVVVNVRFISATNRDPEAAVSDGALREDLYYRLRVVPIRVPPLRERVEDIEILATAFLAYYWRKHRGMDELPPRLGGSAIRALRAYPWPGNVRELQNVIEHAVILVEPRAELSADDLSFSEGGTGMAATSVDVAETYYQARDRIMARFESEFLTRLITRAGGNLSKAARFGGIDRTTFYRLLQRNGLRGDLP